MRLSAGIAVLGLTLSACAAITGLQDYRDEKGDGGLSDPDGSGPPGSTAEGGSSGDDSSDSLFEDVDIPPDVDIDSPPPCGPASCPGCCTAAGVCSGGSSVISCGAGGGSCTDCTNKGGACSSAGACTTKPDTGTPPPACQPMTCKNNCIPIYQRTCCTSNGSCGCIPNFGGGSCQ